MGNSPAMAETASMTNESTIRTTPESGVPLEDLRIEHDVAWRKTFAAALRVMDHHRAHLEANMTIRRLRRDEQRAAHAPAGSSGGR